MRRAALALFLIAVAGSGLGGCGGSGGGGAGGAAGAAAGSGTCQTIRLCTLDCGDDACVTTQCKPRGSADAQTTFQALYDCTKNAGACAAPNDVNCLCQAQCLQDPPCGAELDACVGATSDPICEVTCH